MAERYDSTSHERGLIDEVEAHLTFRPYTKSDELYYRFMKFEFYSHLLEGVSKKKFDQLFNSVLQLLGLKDPISAVESIGNRRDSIDEYVKAVDELKRELGVQDAIQRGIQRQNILLSELKAIKSEAMKYVNETNF